MFVHKSIIRPIKGDLNPPRSIFENYVLSRLSLRIVNPVVILRFSFSTSYVFCH